MNAIHRLFGLSPEAVGSQDTSGSLRPLKVLLLLCVAVPIALLLTFAVHRHDQMQQEAEVRMRRSLSIAHEQALRVLDTNETVLRHALYLTESLDDTSAVDAKLHTRLVELARNKPQIQGITLVGPDGRLLANSRVPDPPPLDLSDRDYFQWHAQNKGGLYISEPIQKGKLTGEPFFVISRARRAADGTFAGVVAVNLRPTFFTEFHQKIAADEPGVAITLFRDDGVVYSRWPDLAHAPKRMGSNSEVLQRVMKGESEGTIRSVSSLDNQQRLILFQRLGDYPIYIGTGRELAAIKGDLYNELGKIALFALIPVLGIIYAAYFSMQRTRESLNAARKLHEESVARRQVEEALLQAQKLEALGRLTGGVAHDFNNALMVISGNVHLLKSTQSGAPAKYVEAIGRATESATKLTRQLLAFSRRQAHVPETIRLQERLPSMRDLISPILGSGIQLSIAVEPSTLPVFVDPAELELAMLNLAANARDAMPGGGSFRLAAGNIAEGPQVGKPWVRVEASDTGSGMDLQVARSAFEPFFTTKPIGKGTGLGLSQVQALCKRAGGEISLDSKLDQGTTVRMVFPASDDEAAEQLSEPPASVALSKSVLLVEDNMAVASVIVPVLEKLGCTVVHMESAEEALHWMATRPNDADLLLTDVVMPGGMDGASLADQVRTTRPGLAILLMTGYTEQLETISARGFEVLPKPFSPRALTEAIARVFAAQNEGGGDREAYSTL